MENAMYAMIGKDWYVTFDSEREADAFALHVRAKYGDRVWVERVKRGSQKSHWIIPRKLPT